MARDGTERIRSIDPAFWRHPKTLAVMAEDVLAVLLLIGIRSAPADDDGRFRADTLSLKSTIFPVAPDATPQWVDAALRLLEKHRLIHLYECDGARYGIIHDWKDWQKIERPHASLMPDPPKRLCRCCNPGASSPTSRRQITDTSGQMAAGREGSGLDRSGLDGKGGDSTALPPRPTWPAEMAALKAIPGYPFDERKDQALMDSLAETYTGMDLAKETHKLKAWLASKDLLPLKGQARPRARLRRWMENADRFARDDEGRRSGGADSGRPRREGPARADEFRQTGSVDL